MLKRNLIFLNVGQSMSLTGLMICAFRLSVWKLFVLILGEYCKFFLFVNSLQKMQNILFSFPSNLSPSYLSMPPSTCIFFWSKQVFQMLC